MVLRTGWPRLSFTNIFGVRKLESLATVWRCLCDPTFSRFSKIPTYADGRTNKRTDRHRTTAISRAGKNDFWVLLNVKWSYFAGDMDKFWTNCRIASSVFLEKKVPIRISNNVGKLTYMRTGSRHNVRCMNIITVNAREKLWCDKIQYLGIDLIAARVIKCSHCNAKHKFYTVFDAVSGKVGRSASEEVIIQLLSTRCFPVLYYGLEVCPVTRNQARSLDYAVYRCFRQTFLYERSVCRWGAYDVFWMPPCTLHNDREKNKKKFFFTKFRMSPNQLCVLGLFKDKATADFELQYINSCVINWVLVFSAVLYLFFYQNIVSCYLL